MKLTKFVTYAKQVWADRPKRTSPVSAARLNYMEAGIKNNNNAISEMAEKSYAATEIDSKFTELNGNLTKLETELKSDLTELDVFVTPEMHGAVGDGVTDDTQAWEKAVETGKKIICTKGKTYLIRSVGNDANDNAGNAQFVLTSGQSIDFNGTTILWKHQSGRYKSLFVVSNASNVEIYNGILYGDRDTNATEFFHPINILSSKNIRVANMNIRESGGDGIVINEYGTSKVPSEQVEIADCHIYHAYRNALSIIMADNVEVHGCKFELTYGTSPHAGIDIEPNRIYEFAKNINVHHCSFIGNAGRNFLVTYNNNPAEISVTVDNCYFELGGTAVTISSGTIQGGADDTVGTISINNCVSKNAGTNAILLNGNTSGNMRIEISDFTIIDSNYNNRDIVSTGSSIQVVGYADDCVAQNIHLNNIHIIGTTQTRDLYLDNADVEFSGDFQKGFVLNGASSNIRANMQNAPKVIEERVLSLQRDVVLYQKYIKPPEHGLDTEAKVVSMPSKFDIEFINLNSEKDIQVIDLDREVTYRIPPCSIGYWIGSEQKVVGEKQKYTAVEVGLGNVENVKQYSQTNPPPYPVTSVNGNTGAVTIDIPTKLSEFTNDIYKTVEVVATYEDGTTNTLTFIVDK